MKRFLFPIMIAFLSSCDSQKKVESATGENDHSAHASQSASETKPKSPKKMAMSNIGENHVHIEYNSPSKRGRLIFGGLVAYGEVWVTGAHKATSISFSKPVIISGVRIEKGKYALFSIPGEKEWTIIINKNWDQHLADDYDLADDLVRLQTKPTTLDTPVESLTFEVKEIDKTKGSIAISWDNLAVSFVISNV